MPESTESSGSLSARRKRQNQQARDEEHLHAEAGAAKAEPQVRPAARKALYRPWFTTGTFVHGGNFGLRPNARPPAGWVRRRTSMCRLPARWLTVASTVDPLRVGCRAICEVTFPLVSDQLLRQGFSTASTPELSGARLFAHPLGGRRVRRLAFKFVAGSALGDGPSSSFTGVFRRPDTKHRGTLGDATRGQGVAGRMSGLPKRFRLTDETTCRYRT